MTDAFTRLSAVVGAVSVRTTPTFRPESDTVPFHVDPAQYLIPRWCCVWDIAPGDQRFLVARSMGSGQSADQRMVLVQNWLEEVKAKVGR